MTRDLSQWLQLSLVSLPISALYPLISKMPCEPPDSFFLHWADLFSYSSQAFAIPPDPYKILLLPQVLFSEKVVYSLIGISVPAVEIINVPTSL